MDLTNKKVAKKIIKLACCVRCANVYDLMILDAMIRVKFENIEKFDGYDSKFDELVNQIRNNDSLCALLGIKDNK